MKLIERFGKNIYLNGNYDVGNEVNAAFNVAECRGGLLSYKIMCRLFKSLNSFLFML